MDGSGSNAATDAEARRAQWFDNPRVPALVKTQIRSLLKGGLVDAAKLDLAIEACNCAGKPERAHAFLTATHYLESQGVNVRDTLRMALTFNRKVNPDWGVKRWKDEHDKLGRLATMQRLSAENVQYDLARYDALLPPSYPGYLIRSSRRLGMEGLRQQHCVAGYDTRVRSGSLAIASVFAGGQRWTVELRTQSGVHLESGQYVEWLDDNQVKGRRNRDAPPGIRAQIKDALGISGRPPGVSMAPRSSSSGAEAAAEWEEHLAHVCRALQEIGVHEVYVNFDGSGDSGTVDCAYVSQCDERVEERRHRILQETEVVIPRLRCGVGADGRPGEAEWEDATMSIAEAIDQFAEHWTEHCDTDWCNDDGGFGSITINAQTGAVECEAHFRTTDSELGSTESFNVFEDAPNHAPDAQVFAPH